MGTEEANAWLDVVERVGALSGASLLVLNVIGLVRQWVVPWPMFAAERKEKIFFRDLHLKKEAIMLELGGDDDQVAP